MAEAWREQQDPKLLVDNAWIKIQSRTFTKWCNTYLLKRDLKIEDLQVDLRDGFLLCNLLEVISSEQILKFGATRKNMRIQQIEVNNSALEFLEAKDIKLVNVGGEDIVEGNVKIILGLIWTIILRYQVNSTDQEGESARGQLLAWVNSKLPNVPVSNFSGDWSDAKALDALVHALRGDVCPSDAIVDPEVLAAHAFELAEESFDIPQLLDPEDIGLDELSMMTYVSYFRDWDGQKDETATSTPLSGVEKVGEKAAAAKAVEEAPDNKTAAIELERAAAERAAVELANTELAGAKEKTKAEIDDTCVQPVTKKTPVSLPQRSPKESSDDVDPVTSRVTDAQEDGNMRSPIHGLFPPDLPVATSLIDAFTPVGKSGGAPKNLKKCIRIAETHIQMKLDSSSCNPSIKLLSPTEGAAITLYSMENFPKEESVYHLVNAALRSEDRTVLKPWVPYVWLLCNALHKLPESPSTIVYRGVRLPLPDGNYLPESMITKGKEFCLSAFTSTTLDLETLNSTAFLGPTGERVAWVMEVDSATARNIKPFSLVQKEEEVLLMPNCRFHVQGSFQSGDGLLMVQVRTLETLDAIIQKELEEDEW
jgi:Calponin homology (CH) domain/NAD:arginine ADP-ribosyltransferase